MCCRPWGCKESDRTERLNQTDMTTDLGSDFSLFPRDMLRYFLYGPGGQTVVLRVGLEKDIPPQQSNIIIGALRRKKKGRKLLLPLVTEEGSGNLMTEVSHILLTSIKNLQSNLRNSLFSVPIFILKHSVRFFLFNLHYYLPTGLINFVLMWTLCL